MSRSGQKTNLPLVGLISVGTGRTFKVAFWAANAGEHDVAYAFVEPLSSSCKLWAYASVIDSSTGDKTTVPVQVLER